MNENSQIRTCSRCGATVAPGALKGLCPRCLMALNLATQTEVSGDDVGPTGNQVVKPPPAPAPSPEEIAKLFPQFEIIECLGRGGMGAVYKARQPRLDRFVALKILLRERQGDNQFAERFAREARALARLNHPDIVAVYDFGEAGGYPYLVMEFVDGLSLRQLLERGKLTPEEALVIVPKICEALQFAHQQGIVHRDIKPENILLDKHGQVKIADFGIAKILVPGAQDLSLTGGKDVVGTPHYMAPEQVEQPTKVDHRADIYSLGVVFYEMLTGELPLGKFQPPSKKVQVDVRLDEVVLHALEKEPGRRYQHASDVKSDVETIAATQSPSPPTGRSPVPVHVKRWRDLWPWDTGYLALFLSVPAFAAGVLFLILMPQWGLKALWLFAFELIGIGLAATYAWVGHRIQRLRAALPRPTGEVAEGLVFWRPFQSPGLAVLHADRLELIPIKGSPITVALEDIVAVSEVRWFNGTRLWWKRGFVLELADGRRVGVAVAEPFARRWRARLSRGSLPEIPADSNIIAAVMIVLAISVGVLLLAIAIPSLSRARERARAMGLTQDVPPPVAALLANFGPVREVTLNDIDELRGAEALDLDSGKLLDLPKDLETRPEPGQMQWLKDQSADLLLDNVDGRWGLMTIADNELKLVPLLNNSWEASSESSLSNALSGPPGGVKADPQRLHRVYADDRWEMVREKDLSFPLPEALEVKQRGPWRAYALATNAQPPLTFAFKTASGASGLLQITAFAEKPNSARLRYKLERQNGLVSITQTAGVGSAADSPSFSEVVQLTVTDLADLDKGTLLNLPFPGVLSDRDPARYDWFNSDTNAFAFMRRGGIDLFQGNHGLIGVDLLVVPLESKDWRGLTPAELRSKLDGLQLPRAPSSSIIPGERRPFGFQTREGALGIFEITKANLPRGVNIRYKLVQFSSAGDSRTFTSQQAGSDILRLKLGQAELQAAKDNVALLQAEIAGDANQVAQVRLSAAQNELAAAKALFDTGLIPNSEYQAAQNAVELRQAELRAVRAARSVAPSAIPVIERQLRTAGDAAEDRVLDLDDGRLLSVPPDIMRARVNNPRPLLNWMVAHGADLVVSDYPSSTSLGFHLDDGLLLRPADNTTFDGITASASDVGRQLAQREASQDADVPKVDIGAQPVFLFKTREGGVGVLQILDLTDNPRGVKIRYKLLQSVRR